MKEKNAFIFFNCDEEKSQKSMNVFYNKEIFRDLKVSRKALFAKIEEELAAGRIHAIGAGCFLAEIQQTSDVTYRIYDFKRKDKDGNYRQLHTQEASESINYTVLDDYRTNYTPQKNEGQLLVECPYFNTAVYDLTEPMTMDYSELDSFVILIGMKGEGTLTVDGEQVSFRAGETILLPATVKEVSTEGTIKFLETYVLS